MFSCFCFSLQNNSFNSTAAECEEDIDEIHEDDTSSSKDRDENNKENYLQRVTILDEKEPAIWDSQQHVEKNIFDSTSWAGMGLMQGKKTRPSIMADNGKGQPDGIQEMEKGLPCFSEPWGTMGMLLKEHTPPTALRCQDTVDIESRKVHTMIGLPNEVGEQYPKFDENPFLKLQTLETDLCPAVLSNLEESGQVPGPKDASSSYGQGLQPDGVSCREPPLTHKDWQKEVDCVPEEQHGLATSHLLYHITDGDNPLLSPRSSIFCQSQRYVLDPESAPSPPSTQQFMMPRSSSRGNCADFKEPQTVAQLTKHIQNLKRKIRKYEERFEQERKYRPSQSDKISNPEVLKWMNDLAKERKQLKELKMKMSDDRSKALQMSQSSLQGESSGTYSATEQQGAASAQTSSVEETMESVWKRLKDKRQLLNLPENLKVTRQEKSLMKPLYDRYRIIKQLLSTATLIPTIQEEEDSDDDTSQTCPELSCGIVSEIRTDEYLCCSEEESEPMYISSMDEQRAGKQSALSMSNLHEATMPELLDQLRDARADKKRLRKVLREYEDHFLRQTGRSAQKEDRIPMAEEYCEYKQIKAKLRLLEVLINKQDVSKTI
ncbi:protein FAM13C isoform X2 [Pleurodeles waltl]|uniref:protein FAM13C isoform X2 n=1 Tax=Pleurodeles waltl TaxID=8319 RepID=UPI0037095FCA